MCGKNDTIQLTFPAKPEYVMLARLTCSGAASRMGYSLEAIEDIKVAVSEACTNVVTHAYRGQKCSGTVSVRLECSDAQLAVFVIDSGESFDAEHVIKNLKPINSSLALEDIGEGGLGLLLIRALMDEVAISSDYGVVVKMVKLLKRGGVRQYADRVSTTAE